VGTAGQTAAVRPWGIPNWVRSVIFVLLQLAPLAIIWTGIDWKSTLLCIACYLINMVGITAGYHRYFAHRSYKTSRWFRFVLGCLGCTALQNGPLWWASLHRQHHRHSDTPEDVHSPVIGGVWWSHVGWVFAADWNKGELKSVQDLSRYPELRLLNRYDWVPAFMLASLCFLIGGLRGLVVGFFLSNVLSRHAVFLVNSACHLWGRRRFATADRSRNNALVAMLTLGEGWHNNHHHYQSSANQGFRWWEIDITYYLIRLLGVMGLVWGIRKPPREKLIG
jgi:stearoyl-CoA desaturase (delta-9 desaturase)